VKPKWLKGDPVLNAATLIVAGTTGTITGMAVEGLATLAKAGVAIAVGLAVGGLLYAVVGALKRRRSS
jgi:ABC-type uncharacterized transport system permease subunit